MREPSFLNAPTVFIEIRHRVLEVLQGDDGLEIPLERGGDGNLTKASRENVTTRLKSFLKKEIWQPRIRAYCAIGARGVSIRRISLPPAARDNFSNLLSLQIEAEFPLPPEALAWGYRRLRNGEMSGRQGANQELLVVAVKKEVVSEYSDILAECGAACVFTIAALARRELCFHPPANAAVLDVGGEYSELVSFENNLPVSVRVLPWGETQFKKRISEKLDMPAAEADKILAESGNGSGLPAAADSVLEELAELVNATWTGQKLFVSGRIATVKGFAAGLQQKLKSGAACEAITVEAGAGRSAATLGLRNASAAGGEFPFLTLHSRVTNGSVPLAKQVPWKWAGIAAALVLAMVLLPFAQAVLFKGRLTRRLAAVEAQRGQLVMIDRELEFLRHLKQNQPPYLDALFILSKAAPSGTRFDSITMNRNGDLALRGTLKDGTQVAALRSKLIESGFFSSVGVEEQTPTPDRQKVTVRMTAQWKSANDRATLSVGPTAEEIEKAKNRPKDQPGGAFPPMGMPMGMPSMPSMPGGMPSLPPGVSMPSPARRSTIRVMPSTGLGSSPEAMPASGPNPVMSSPKP